MQLKLDRQAEVSILLTVDSRIQTLNLEYRGLNKPTDVLSFAQDDPILLGDIAISIDTASRQAQSANWPLSSELALLSVHGLLHLIGYDDTELDGAQEMERMTRQILNSSNVALPEANHPFFNSFLEDS